MNNIQLVLWGVVMIASISGVLRVMSRGYFELLIVSRGNVYQICLNDVLRILQIHSSLEVYD